MHKLEQNLINSFSLLTMSGLQEMNQNSYGTWWSQQMIPNLMIPTYLSKNGNRPSCALMQNFRNKCFLKKPKYLPPWGEAATAPRSSA